MTFALQIATFTLQITIPVLQNPCLILRPMSKMWVYLKHGLLHQVAEAEPRSAGDVPILGHGARSNSELPIASASAALTFG
jgi:hypothetical protein